MPEKILIVEDNISMRRSIVRLLEQESYQVFQAANGEEGLREYARSSPDMVIMDINMPHMDGLEATQRLREFTGVPILILTVRGAESDKVAGLDTGADDYLTKPFGADELLARIRALLRRRRAPEHAGEQSMVLRLGAGELIIDRGEQRVLLKGQLVRLTPIETRLMFVLAERPGEKFTHKELRMLVWPHDSAGTTQNLKLFVLYLRRKIEPDPEHPKYLITVRGVGYTLAEL